MDPDSTSQLTEPPDRQPGGVTGYGNIAVVILTAGRGTRMRSAIPKVLHPIAGLPMAAHVVRAAREIAPGQIVVTIGPTSEQLRDVLTDDITFAWQPDPLGTGDAARAALPHLTPAIEWVVVIFGDHPLMSDATLRMLIETTLAADPLLATVAVVLPEPGPYGRYRRDSRGRVIGIVEAHEDTQTYDGPTPVNSGACCVQRDWLETAIGDIPLSPKGEYYLTTLVELAARVTLPDDRDPVLLVTAPEEVALGINDRVELAEAERGIRQRINERHMRAGVTLVDPEQSYIDADVTIGADTRIEPGCQLRGRTTIGAGCRIGPQSVIEDSIIHDNVTIRASWIESSEVGSGVDIGPFSHLRPGATLAAGVHIGNYVELKNASIGAGTQIGHFSYVGDSEVGERVNIGAGSITANYDGVAKYRTTIGNDVFIGSDTILRAPVTVGDGGRTGAGAVVTKNVPAGKTVVGVPARVIGPASTPTDTGNK
ncbi:MAG TPA: bifunctional UDP-N-acetylglucosamine diphosphorylase/glucosamine-1-phosphate N-acetyltransferase GlmU [Thermomicrobiales bacterium]|nr:bifunctional UDP-N-acetylglucosamine diphosphorylase/glucosamine-1-phosphate N-acetyltransferase GlmU [Thermomicrobiales bacterium]